MGLNIKNPKLEADIRELAAIQGTGLTEAIQAAISEKLERTRRFSEAEIARRMKVIEQIQAEVKALPVNNSRTSLELLKEIDDEMDADLNRMAGLKP